MSVHSAGRETCPARLHALLFVAARSLITEHPQRPLPFAALNAQPMPRGGAPGAPSPPSSVSSCVRAAPRAPHRRALGGVLVLWAVGVAMAWALGGLCVSRSPPSGLWWVHPGPLRTGDRPRGHPTRSVGLGAAADGRSRPRRSRSGAWVGLPLGDRPPGDQWCMRSEGGDPRALSMLRGGAAEGARCHPWTAQSKPAARGAGTSASAAGAAPPQAPHPRWPVRPAGTPTALAGRRAAGPIARADRRAAERPAPPAALAAAWALLGGLAAGGLCVARRARRDRAATAWRAPVRGWRGRGAPGVGATTWPALSASPGNGVRWGTRDSVAASTAHCQCRGRPSLALAADLRGSGGLVDFYTRWAAEDTSGYLSTPLHCVAFAVEHYEAALAAGRALLRSGALVDARSAKGAHTPLHIAARSGNAAVAKLLLDHRADPRAATVPDRATPLHLAAAESRLDVVTVVAAAAERTPALRGLFRATDRRGRLPVDVAEAQLRRPPAAGAPTWGVWNVLHDLTYAAGRCWRTEGPLPGAAPRGDKDYWIALLDRDPRARWCTNHNWFLEVFANSGRRTFFPEARARSAEARRRLHGLAPHELVFLTNAERSGFVVAQTNSRPCDVFAHLTGRRLTDPCGCAACARGREGGQAPPSVWVRFVWVRPDARGGALFFGLMRRLRAELGGDLRSCWCEMDPAETGIPVEKFRCYFPPTPHRTFVRPPKGEAPGPRVDVYRFR